MAGQVILIDKPLEWTSFDVIKKVRNQIRIKKVGHAGTLDPLATGLLIICTGKFTKRIEEFQAQHKCYEGSMILGATTPSYDLETEPENFKPIEGVDLKLIEQNLEKFRGQIEQVPPAHSAVKIGGVRAYEKARKGEKVALKKREVEITELTVTQVDLPRVDFKVACTKGTYIRSLVHDIGQSLGCGAYMSALRRTKIGDFSVEDASTIDEFIELIERLKG